MRELLIDLTNSKIPASSTLGLPASWAELTDAFEAARIDDERSEYSITILDSKHEYLKWLVPASADIFELNYLAERLESLEEWQMHCFEGMCAMEAQRTEYAPLPLERLINLTFSTEDCQVVYEAKDDEALGRFYADNDFIPELDGLPEKAWDWLDYKKIGVYMREGEGGVFAPHGYVVQNGEFSTKYTSDKCPRPHKPDYAFRMDVVHYLFEEKEEYSQVVTLKLPAAHGELMSVLERLTASTWAETVCTGFEGLISGFEDTFSDMENIGKLNELSQLLIDMHYSNLAKYKALLEATKCVSMDTALQLAENLSQYRLCPELAGSANYAELYLRNSNTFPNESLYPYIDMHRYGLSRMLEDHVEQTLYGMISRHDGGPIETTVELADNEMNEMPLEQHFG